MNNYQADEPKTESPSPEMLLAEIATLREEVAKLQRQNTELELLMEMTTEYSDDVADELFDTAAEKVRLQNLLQNITHSMPSALITLDFSGRVLTWNPAAASLTGLTIEQVQGQILWQVCPQLACYQDLFDGVMAANQVMRRHREQIALKNKMLFYEVSIFPLTNDLKGAVLRIDDVTEWVQLEEIMLQSAKMASIGGLAAGIAHEINNPLSGMLQSVQMLQIALDTQRSSTRQKMQAYKLNPQQLHKYLQAHNLLAYLDDMRASGERAARIVTDLLSFSRKSPAQAAPQDLNKLVEEALILASTDYDLKKSFDFRDLKIVRQLAPNLPPVMCDGPQIEQVILNLVRNAAQALAKQNRANEERGRLIVRTCLAANAALVRLEVEDNGPGIPEEVRMRLFEPFFTTSAIGEGTGLGLWLCWTIVVERHKGRIWAESVSAGGARFVVELPASEQQSAH
ncbi:MAG: PAS domain S-box protein [Anaerolineae bacterium]|nr:PAS domain S-box protein [Anaerolineae bacterium]